MWWWPRLGVKNTTLWLALCVSIDVIAVLSTQFCLKCGKRAFNRYRVIGVRHRVVEVFAGCQDVSRASLVTHYRREFFIALRVSPHVRVYCSVHNRSTNTWMNGFPSCWDVTALLLFYALSSLDGVIMESDISISFCRVICTYGTGWLIEVSIFGYLGRWVQCMFFIRMLS